MIPCHVVEITTPKKFLLRGLWFGPSKAKHAFIFIHGLGGSVFSMRNVLERLIDKNTAVLSFNNRGFEIVTRLRAVKKVKSRLGGAAHEVFTESTDDIQGAVNFAKRYGVKQIFLIGHSTGCQKSVYWASRTKARGVNGIVLLAPVSDWAAETKRQGKAKVAWTSKAARTLVRQGKKHELLSKGVWRETLDAQRFLSLYDPNSIEELFPYAQPKKIPRKFRSIKKPVLVLWAGKDEYADRSAGKVVEWFKTHTQKGEVIIIPYAKHSFKGAERSVAKRIRSFANKIS